MPLSKLDSADSLSLLHEIDESMHDLSAATDMWDLAVGESVKQGDFEHADSESDDAALHGDALGDTPHTLNAAKPKRIRKRRGDACVARLPKRLRSCRSAHALPRGLAAHALDGSLKTMRTVSDDVTHAGAFNGIPLDGIQGAPDAHDESTASCADDDSSSAPPSPPRVGLAARCDGGRKRRFRVCGVQSLPDNAEYRCSICLEEYAMPAALNPWWALVRHECPKCLRVQFPCINITSPANAISYVSEEAPSDSDEECCGSSSDPEAFADDGDDGGPAPPLQPTLGVADADALFALFDHARCCPGKHTSARCRAAPTFEALGGRGQSSTEASEAPYVRGSTEEAAAQRGGKRTPPHV
ncbi:hypothetical protein M885DRAFT_144257 [Pelagophyceae sp. CCMP2097]|nr:hypothetical protein M885DRAFT_144257 [Pelagophyceae sp. CCMP2097]